MTKELNKFCKLLKTYKKEEWTSELKDKHKLIKDLCNNGNISMIDMVDILRVFLCDHAIIGMIDHKSKCLRCKMDNILKPMI